MSIAPRFRVVVCAAFLACLTGRPLCGHEPADTAGPSSRGGKPVAADSGAPRGRLRVTTLDAQTGLPTPTRVEVRGDDGAFHIAADAMRTTHRLADHDTPPPPPRSAEEYIATLGQTVHNFFTRTEQFYTTGVCTLDLPPGRYTVRVFKGIEYRAASAKVVVEAPADAEPEDLTVKLERWIDMPAEGWYSADAHLHIPRFGPEMNGHILHWMQAEDIHIANLLQWGHSRHFHNAPQYAHGPRGVHHEGRYILASGQENPRTPFLGHTIILGAGKAIHIPDLYLLYRSAFAESRAHGGVNGYAHFGTHFHAANGLALDLPSGLVDFIEVLQFNTADYSVWYLTLNSGFRLIPLAGTDYPVGQVPGWERFYAKVEGPISFPAWMKAVRAGRVFVTNGPMLDLRVGDTPIGSQLTLDAPGRVRIRGSVRFDPARDHVDRMELIFNGRVIHTVTPGQDARGGRIDMDTAIPLDAPGWLALRASGPRPEVFIPTFFGARQPEHSGPPSGDDATPASALAHTAPIYIEIAGQPPFAQGPVARATRWAWLAQLRDLEHTLAPNRAHELAGHDRNPTLDEVSMELLEALRPRLLQAIREAEHGHLHSEPADTVTKPHTHEPEPHHRPARPD